MNIKLKERKKYKKLTKHQKDKFDLSIRKEAIFKHQIKQLKKLEFEGFVYVIGSFKHKFFKIGYSSDPYKRLASIQTGCPFQVSVILIFNANINHEKRLHRKFRRENTVGEWFRYKGRFANWLDSKLNTMYVFMGEREKKERVHLQNSNNHLDEQFKRQFSKWG